MTDVAEETKEQKALGCIGVLAVLVVSFPLRFWSILCVYDWHIRALVHGPALDWKQVWACVLFTGLVWSRTLSKPGTEPMMALFWKSLGSTVLYPLLAVGTAWLLR